MPKDALRVSLLHSTSDINELIANKDTAAEKYIEIVHRVLTLSALLDKTDIHRSQISKNILYTIQVKEQYLQELGILDDLKYLMEEYEK